MSEQANNEVGPFFVVTERVIQQRAMAEGMELPEYSLPRLPKPDTVEIDRRPYTEEELKRLLDFTSVDVREIQNFPLPSPDEAAEKAKKRAMRESMWGIGGIGLFFGGVVGSVELTQPHVFERVIGGMALITGGAFVQLARNLGKSEGVKAAKRARTSTEERYRKRQNILAVHQAALNQLQTGAEVE